SRDLDQALHIERGGRGYRVSYAIADAGALVSAQTTLSAEPRTRGVPLYAPCAKAPVYPPPLSEGSGSLLPGQRRPAVLWTIDLDADGRQQNASVARAEVQ